MASLRRSKALSPDGQTARFLYTILKQLDLKTIDWNLVANGLDITNGHAARMRFSRFKQHMEGAPVQPRNPRPKKDVGNKEKNAEGKGRKRVFDADVKEEGMKVESGDAHGVKIKSEPACCIKSESRLSEESHRAEEQPTVKVKREPKRDERTGQNTGMSGYPALPAPAQEVVPFMGLPYTSRAATTNPAATATVAPPMATVSLADLHLSPQWIPQGIPQVPRLDTATPNSVFPARLSTPPVHGKVAVTGVKPEPGLINSTVQAAGGHPRLKTEPICL